MIIPTIRPMIAPIVNDGMNSPAGILIPKVNIVIVNLKMNAKMRRPIDSYTPGPACAMEICF